MYGLFMVACSYVYFACLCQRKSTVRRIEKDQCGHFQLYELLAVLSAMVVNKRARARACVHVCAGARVCMCV